MSQFFIEKEIRVEIRVVNVLTTQPFTQRRPALETALRGRDEQNKRGATYLFSCRREGRR